MPNYLGGLYAGVKIYHGVCEQHSKPRKFGNIPTNVDMRENVHCVLTQLYTYMYPDEFDIHLTQSKRMCTYL